MRRVWGFVEEVVVGVLLIGIVVPVALVSATLAHITGWRWGFPADLPHPD